MFFCNSGQVVVKSVEVEEQSETGAVDRGVVWVVDGFTGVSFNGKIDN